MDANRLAEYEAKARQMFNLSIPDEVCYYLGEVNGVEYLAFKLNRRGGYFGLPVFIAITNNGEMHEITELGTCLMLYKAMRKKVYSQM